MSNSVVPVGPLIAVPRIIDGHLIFDEKEVVAVFEVTSKLNSLTAATSVLDAAVDGFNLALSGLREGERVQVVVDCKRYDVSSAVTMMKKRVSKKAAVGFQGYYPGVLADYLEAYCRYSMVPVIRYFILFSYVMPKGRLDGEQSLPLKLKMQETDRRAENFLNALRGLTIDIRRLGETALVDLVDQALNPSRLSALPSQVLARAPVEAGLDPSRAELLVRSPISNPAPTPSRRFDFIQIGSTFARNIGFMRVPGDYSRDAIEELVLCQSEFRFSYHVEGLSQDKTKAYIQKRRSHAAGTVTMAGGRNSQRGEEQAAEYDNLLRQAERNEIHFLRWSGYLSIFSDDEQKLRETTSQLSAKFSNLVPEEGIYRQVDYWVSGLPLGRDLAGNPLLATAQSVAGLFPFFEYNSSSPEGGILLGFSPANQPVFFDPWSRVVRNANVFITGKPGSGKSFLINNILNRLHPEAYDVSIIDKAKSYKFSTRAAEGDYVEWTLDGVRHAVNIWDVIPYDPSLIIDEEDFNDCSSDGSVNATKIEQITGLCEIFMAENGGSLSKKEAALLASAVKQTYLRVYKNGGNGNRVPVFDDLSSTLMDEIKSSEEHRSLLQDLLLKLNPAVSGGSLAGILNRQTTLNTEATVRTFDISAIPEKAETQGIVMYILTSWLLSHWRRNKAQHIRQIAVIDELYFMMQFEAGRRLLDNLARRSRHLGLVCFLATQQLDDVLQFKETAAILRNCETKILFTQDESVIGTLTSLLGLSDNEAKQILGLRSLSGVYSQAFFSYGNSMRNVVTVRPDPATRWLNTTEPTYDVPKRDRALAQAGGDPWEAVRILVEQGN